MDPRKTGNEMSDAFLAELLFTQISPTCSHANSCQHHWEWVMLCFFHLLSRTGIPICLSQPCCPLVCAESRLKGLPWKKAGHGKHCGLSTWDGECVSKSAEWWQQDLRGLGGEMTMFQVEFVTNENIIYPYSQMICVRFWCFYLNNKKKVGDIVICCLKMQWNIYRLNIAFVTKSRMWLK